MATKRSGRVPRNTYGPHDKRRTIPEKPGMKGIESGKRKIPTPVIKKKAPSPRSRYPKP